MIEYCDDMTEKQARLLVEKMLEFFNIKIDGYPSSILKTKDGACVLLDKYFSPMHFSSWRNMLVELASTRSIVLKKPGYRRSGDFFEELFGVSTIENPFYRCSSIAELKIMLDLLD